MCCFSVATPVGLLARWLARPVRVSKTNIFARGVDGARQRLAYGMNLEIDQEVAMVLPLPVPPGSGEDAVLFVDLSRSPRIFAELAALFDVPEPATRSKGGIRRSARTLAVHAVGSFVASYVPGRADFARLDARFRLPEALFTAAPQYDDYGFAVFQLAPGKVTVHPMGLDFPTRRPDALFFPTIHVHDGGFHATARFDHALYFQHPDLPTGARSPATPDETFRGDATSWAMPREDYGGMIDPQRRVARRRLDGRLPNVDTWI